MKKSNNVKKQDQGFYLKNTQLLLLIFLMSLFGTAQYNYTWMKGSNITAQQGIYGSMGVPAISNTPGARDIMASWKDASGNFWLFGGEGYDGNSQYGILNDLWKYNPLTNQWTWIKGSNGTFQNGTYGTIGVASALNMPGSRTGAASWVDVSGNFWMFGGNGNGATLGAGDLNDLWKYNPSTNQWTWVKGSTSTYQVPGYGTQGVPLNSNDPGARSGSASWADASGNLWLFGGVTFSNSAGDLNDLWKYNIAANQWTWMKGSNLVDQNGTYGSIGIAATGNSPGGRYLSGYWNDASGSLWLFGGLGYDASATSEDNLNDLWRYNISTNQWTWIKGSNTNGQQGTYGTLGNASPLNVPGGRVGSVCWADATGNFFLFGGSGYDGTNGDDFLNDLWKYNITTNQWTWLKGSNLVLQNGTYGTQGLISSTNVPGARAGASGWTDASYNLWLFGGDGLDENNSSPDDLNDLWRLGSCVSGPTVSIVSTTSSLCAGNSATLIASGAGSYSWSNAQTGSLTVVSPSLAGITTFTSYGSDLSGCQGSATINLNVFALPTVTASSASPVICKGVQVKISASGAVVYLWNTTPISNTSTILVTPTVTTVYHVTGTDVNGCSNTYSVTQTVNSCTGIEAATSLTEQYVIYPNPNNGTFTISGNGVELSKRFIVFNALGQIVFEDNLTSDLTNIQTQLQKGIYYFNILQNDQKISAGKIVVN